MIQVGDYYMNIKDFYINKCRSIDHANKLNFTKNNMEVNNFMETVLAQLDKHYIKLNHGEDTTVSLRLAYEEDLCITSKRTQSIIRYIVKKVNKHAKCSFTSEGVLTISCNFYPD